MRRLITLLAAICLLAAPAAALAQSAGDEQYSDPFGDQAGQPNDSQDEPAAETPAEQPTAPSTTGGGATASQTSDGPSLPRTGLPAAILAGSGLLLLLGGGSMRRRAAPAPGRSAGPLMLSGPEARAALTRAAARAAHDRAGR
jgi:hypothetical protein